MVHVTKNRRRVRVVTPPDPGAEYDVIADEDGTPISAEDGTYLEGET
jgi:hypothetical protein